MGKKLFNGSILYLIGMALVIVGLLLPIAKFPIIGEANVFDLVNFKNFNIRSVSALLIAIGAILGILFVLLLNATKTHRLIALAITLAGGVILLLYLTGVISDSKVASWGQKTFLGKNFIKNIYIGFYVILAGWVLSIYGWISGK